MVCRGLLFLMKLLLLVPPICAFCWHKELELWLMSIEKQSWFALLILFTSLLMLIGGLVGSLLNYILPMRRLVSTVEEDSENSLKRQKIDSIHGFTNRDNQIVDEGNVDIDENLHSRQLAVYGRETMKRLLGAKVLISGLQGLGAEVAKNLILAGVKSVTLHDEGLVEMWDLSSDFLFSEHDIGKNRALASVKKLQELNSSVVVFTWTSKISKEQLSNFQAVVFTEIDYERAIEFSEYCHNHNPSIPFIKADIRGLFGSVFCDFGPEFTVFDVKGEEPHTGIVASITNDDPAIVSLIEDERPDFQDGDLVVFTEVEGMTELNDGKPRKISSSKPYGFVLEEDTRNFGAYEKGGIVTEVLQPKALHFKTLKEALKDPGEFLISDFSKFDRSPLLHLAFQALDKFVSEFGHFPVAASEEDATKLVSFAKINNETSSDRKLDRLDENVLRIFASGSHAVLNPMAAMFGGITGQEVIKACTGKFHPIFQFFYFDSIESLPGCPLRPEDVMPLNCRYDAQISVFGREMQQKLEKAKIFVVGAGALGCEFLKNLALMGASCGNQGKLTITDDDVIEKSNLSRQFLFRDWNIGQAKSTVAATATTEINPCLQIEALQSRVSAATENIFDDTFWENLGVVISALDNIDARLYVDRRCVYFQKPMLESGTLGTKCHTQVIIPHLTENYGASRDPPEKQMPMCTIHYFPHNIEHCLAWARSEFEGLLEKTPSDVNAFLSNPKEFITSIRLRGDTQVRNLLERILECLVFERCLTFEDCVAWSRRKFEDYFSNRVKLLIYQFPKNAKTSENTPFWASPKRFPNPLQFTSSDPAHLSFIAAASILRAQTYGIPIPEWATNSDKLAEVVDKVQVPDFQPEKGVKIVTDESATNINSKDKDGSGDTEDMIQMLEEGVRLLPSRFQMNPILFEKDDDTNYHMDLILGLANMRARNYSIPEVDKLKAKIRAGKIIPAIATTTAMATGLVCLELYKLLSGHRVEKYRNTFANLALPLLSMAEPVPPKKIRHRNLSWTVWDRWIIQQNLTIQEFLGWFEVKGLTVYVISWDDVLVYNALFPKHRERLSKKVIDLVKDTGKWSKHSSRHCIDLEVVCEDEEGNNVDVPGVSVCCN